ncbi:hypothetical protein C1H46_022245 [Malus baccata]|uniref:ABC transporter domain-containing protein n=1 Tax=Malus baccata TaxID=106549 RepID=A0A540M0T7_MALBA|nr:hypothetical protein C1H46_022245 [Malus baccata]
MELSSKLHRLHLRSTFISGSSPFDARATVRPPRLRSLSNRIASQSLRDSNNTNSIKTTSHLQKSTTPIPKFATPLSAVALETSVAETTASDDDVDISSGVKLENVRKSYKGVTVLKDVTWEVKKGDKVGLVGVNGAGKTTQMRIIAGLEEPDSGNVIKAKPNMKIAFLSQEFEVSLSRTVKEEFMSAFKEEMEVAGKLEKVQKALESSVNDLELMGRLLDEFDKLQNRAQAADLDMVDSKINKLMPELGFAPEDTDRLVASFSSGWQMRMSLGKILLQDPDLLLLDEPTNHLDLDTIEWLEDYLNRQDVPMVIISHDRAFLDQLCTKIVETDMGVSRTYEGNYSQYILAKAAWIETQNAAWEKQQKEIEQTRDLIHRLGAGANSGRASSAEKAEALDLNKTVLETVEEAAEDWRLDDIKGLLGRCNFKSDMLDRKVSLLSGGEKEAITEYKGTVITVSHDRYFIKQIVNRVVEVKDCKLQNYAGDYNYYLEKNLDARERELEREAEIEEKAPKVKAKSKMSKAEKEARKKQKMQAFQQAKAKSKGTKNAKRWN